MHWKSRKSGTHKEGEKMGSVEWWLLKLSVIAIVVLQYIYTFIK
jgi:hypothetical protein